MEIRRGEGLIISIDSVNREEAAIHSMSLSSCFGRLPVAYCPPVFSIMGDVVWAKHGIRYEDEVYYDGDPTESSLVICNGIPTFIARCEMLDIPRRPFPIKVSDPNLSILIDYGPNGDFARLRSALLDMEYSMIIRAGGKGRTQIQHEITSNLPESVSARINDSKRGVYGSIRAGIT